MFKKGISVLLVLMMLIGVFSVLPLSASAEEADETGEAVINTVTDDTQSGDVTEAPADEPEDEEVIAKEESDLADVGADEDIADDGADVDVAGEGAEVDTAEEGGGTYGSTISRKYAMEVGTSTSFYISEVPTSYSSISSGGFDINDGNGVISYSRSGDRVRVKAVRPGTATVKVWAISYCAYDSLYDAIEWTIYVYNKNDLSTPKITGSKSKSDGLQISWDWVPGAQKYRLFYKSGKSWVKVGDTTSTSFVHAGIKVGTTLTYTVRCINSAGTQYTSGFNSTGWRLTRYLPVTPIINASTQWVNGIILKWKKVEGAVRYRLYKRVKGQSSWASVGDVTDTDCYDFSVKRGVTYEYTVRCVSADGTAYTSDYYKKPWSVTYDYDLHIPAITSLVSTSSGIKITWDNNGTCDMVKWRLYYKTGKSGWSRLKEVNNTADWTYTFTAAQLGVPYSFTVRGIGEDGDFITGFNSTGWSHTRYLSTPAAMTFSDSGTGVTARWNAVSGAAKYRVFYKSGKGWTTLGDTTATSYFDKAVPVGATRVYTVRCVNAAGNLYTSGFNTSGWSHTRYLGTPSVSKFADTSTGTYVYIKAVSGAVKYRVFYKNGSGWTQLGDTTTTSFFDKNSPRGAVRTYTVRCMTAANAYASNFNATGWSHVRYLDTPSISKGESVSTGMKLTIKAVTGAVKYRVFYKNGSGWTQLGDTTSTSFIDTTAVPGVARTYTVRCMTTTNAYASNFNATGWSGIRYLDTPSITKGESMESGMKLTISAVSGAQKYRVFYKNGSGWTQLGDTTTTSFIDTTAVQGAARTYTVRCMTADNVYASSFNATGWSYTYKFPDSTAYPVLKSAVMDADGDLKVEIEDNTAATASVSYYALYIWGNQKWNYIGYVYKGRNWIFGPDLVKGQRYNFAVLGCDTNNEFVTDYYVNGFYFTI